MSKYAIVRAIVMFTIFAWSAIGNIFIGYYLFTWEEVSDTHHTLIAGAILMDLVLIYYWLHIKEEQESQSVNNFSGKNKEWPTEDRDEKKDVH